MSKLKSISFIFVVLFIGLLFTKPASAFGTDGKVITSFGHDAAANKVAFQSDGKAVVVGYASNGTNNDWALVRYTVNGSFDSSFGVNGKVIQDLGNNDTLNAVSIQSDGKLVVGGNRYITGGDIKWIVARYNTDGTLDNSFGGTGIVTTVFGFDNDGNPYAGAVNDIAIQADGKIIAVGVILVPRDNIFKVALARYNADGTLDTGFGTGGKIIIQMSDPGSSLSAVTIQPDNKILAYGDKTNGVHREIFILRFNPDGSFDNSFGSGGQVLVPLFGNFDDHARDVVLQADGKIVVTGAYGDGSYNTFSTFVLRYNADGTADTTFANNGQFLNSYAPGNDAANAILLNTDGSILLGGYNFNGTHNDFAIRKLLPNGTIDTNFGTNGSEIIPMGNGESSIASMALDSVSRILAVGSASNGSYNDWALARLPDIFSNNPPEVNPFPNATIDEGQTYTENGSFTDADSTSWTATVDYGDGSGVNPLTLNPDKTFTLNHLYTDNGTYTVTVIITDNQGAAGTQTATVTVRTPVETLLYIADQIQDIIAAHPGTPLTDKLEDAQAKTEEARQALLHQPPDTQKALGEIEGAVGDIYAAVTDGLLDTATGNNLMQQLSGVARQLASDAIQQAIDRGGNPTVIQEAQDYFAEAEHLRSTGTYKDAVNKYKDALAKAESA